MRRIRRAVGALLNETNNLDPPRYMKRDDVATECDINCAIELQHQYVVSIWIQHVSSTCVINIWHQYVALICGINMWQVINM